MKFKMVFKFSLGVLAFICELALIAWAIYDAAIGDFNNAFFNLALVALFRMMEMNRALQFLCEPFDDDQTMESDHKSNPKSEAGAIV